MTVSAYFRLLVLSAFCLLAAPVFSQPVSDAPIVPGERLSDWLLRNVPTGGDTTSLHWLVPAEVHGQENLRRAVLLHLSDRAVLTQRLSELPATGRLNLAESDARWLQGAPAQDPVLQLGQQVRKYDRPKFVAVLTESGAVCTAPHRPGAFARDYLLGCLGVTDASLVDFAWMAQPDGYTSRVGIAAWNQTTQDQPAPGAWIWAPSRKSGIRITVSDNLIRFLATQPPAEFLASDFVAGHTPASQAIEPTLKGFSNAAISASDWGEIGLLQTPSARMAPTGEMRFTWSKVEPYTRGTLMLQPLDWLEAGFRYSDISNRLYGPSIAGDQTLKDKSIDLKIRLMEEASIRPQLAVGVRDIGGTGLFSGEYLVANKRWGSWDASLGLGWGYLGARADLSGAGVRLGNTEASGGTANFKDMFKGPMALFGGVQWQSPDSQWLLKAEWEGNNYQREPNGNNQVVSSPTNWGAVYRYSPNLDFSAAWERGNRLMLGLTFHMPLNRHNVPKVLDPVLPPVLAVGPAVLPPHGWTETVQNLELYTGWGIQRITQERAVISVVVETDGAPHVQERVNKVITLLHRDVPAHFDQFELKLQDRGLPVSRIVVDRAEWVAQNTLPVPPAMRLPVQQLLSPSIKTTTMKATSGDAVDTAFSKESTGTFVEWAPSYQQILGGPDDFVLYQAGFQAKLEHRFSSSTWVSADFNARLLDNYKNFKYDAPSDLPRVRTLQREFTTTNRTTMPLAQATSVADLGNGNYASVYGGMLESMYGGVGVEWMYRPWQGRVAFGVDINHVQQRSFKQDFGFRDYSVNTGHATLYWDTGWNNIQVNLSAGQYLAGDVGATLDIKRVFQNGVALGAWATKTNVSAEQFGEGSFDKGIYITMPFDVLAPKSTPGIANIVWNPLTRDGGARLERRFKLYDLTRYRDNRTWSWRPYSDEVAMTGLDTSYVLAEPQATLLDAPFSTGAQLGRQMAAIPASTWGWAAGIVVGSSLFDKSLDDWFQNRTGDGSRRLGGAANNLPYAMAATAGMLYLGVAGESAANTAATSITAAAYTLGANALTRYAVGRARPLDGQGTSSFNGFKSEAVRSGFASNHVAVAFAMATPFAQQYNMPWLYAAAASTGLGRLNDREHWLSDTVAGGLMGYAIGSLLSDQQQGQRRGVRMTATPQSIDATWSF